MLLISGRKDMMKIIVMERAICMKEDDGKEYVIAYLNNHLLDTKTRYVFIAKLYLSLYYIYVLNFGFIYFLLYVSKLAGRQFKYLYWNDRFLVV
jgi:hypothetical protein